MRGQENATHFLTRIAAFVSGTLFAVFMVFRRDIAILVIGHQSDLAESIFVIFCLVYLANVPVHGLNLLLIARGRQKKFVWIVGLEAILNIMLTIVFVLVIGPVGAAYATLLTLVVSNLIVFPIVVRREFSDRTAERTVVGSLGATVLGAVLAIIGALPVVSLGPGLVRLLAASLLGGGLSLLVGLIIIKTSGRRRLKTMLLGP